MKKDVKIFDSMFAHAKYSTDNQDSKYINWVRDQVNSDDTVFFTDGSIKLAQEYSIKRKIGWLLESPVVTTSSYEWMKVNYNDFDVVFTHNKELLDLNEKFKFAPTGGCWIFPKDQQIHDKTKNISIIASPKKYLLGHRLRHEVVEKFSFIDTYGRGYKVLDNKLEGLKDYRFSVAIENTNEDYYFTEKLIDCFMTGTVPIYWGCPSIGEFFNEKGMIKFDNIEDVAFLDFDEKKYESMLSYIKENFEKAKEFIMSEDYIWKKYFIDK